MSTYLNRSLYFAIKRGYPRHPRTTALNLAKSFLVSLPALFMPIVILGGIFSGMFTPTEAGAVAVAYSLVLGGVAYRSLSWGGIKQVFIESAYTTASVMLVVIACSLFAWILAIEQIPTMLGNFIISIVHMNGALFLLAVNLFLLFLGCFLEPVAAMLITIPIFMPICVKLGIHPVHFGIIVVLNLMIGLLTPPVGLVLNVMADLVDRPFAQLVKAVFPFMIVLIVVLFIVTYFPGLVMFLPRLLGYV